MIRPFTLIIFSTLLSSYFTPLYATNLMPSDTLIGHNLDQELRDMKAEDAFLMKDLKRGYQYAFIFKIKDSNACLPDLKMDFEHERLRESAWQIMIQFIATQETALIKLTKNCEDGLPNDYHVSSKCVDCPREALSTERSLAVIQTDINLDAEYLVKDVFLGGGCFDVENVTRDGSSNSMGTFSKGMTSIDMENGVILATGNVKNAEGPNNENGAGNSFGLGIMGDPDLKKLLPFGSSPVTDVSVLEFDFTPTVDQISFEYVFASEEYCEYVGEQYNDVFGFFISGPGINGPFSNNAINIARIPGSSDYVSINSVNFTQNKAYYHDNVSGINALTGGCKFGEIFNGTKAKSDIQYDGFTHVLTAIANVIPCETYHIKLAVGDVGDRVWDSAVFLKAGSFNAGGKAALSVNVPQAKNPTAGQAIEGCQESYLVFERGDGENLFEDLLVNFTISDSSTATKNFDYIPPSSPVIIPAGQQSVQVPFQVIDDPFEEEDETIIFVLENPCSCQGKETALVITEAKPFDIDLPALTTCPGGTVNLAPLPDSVATDYSYVWNTGSTASSISETLQTETTYAVTVTDICGVEASDSVKVTFSEQKATLSGEISVCNGETTGQMEVNFTGSAPYTFEYTIDGNDQTISNITESTFVLPANQAGVYQATGMMSNGCVGVGEGRGIYNISDVDFQLKVTNPKCFDSRDGKISIDIESDEYVYQWSNGANTTQLENLDAGTYGVEVINNTGCSTSKEVELKAPRPLVATLKAQGIANCYNPRGGSIEVEVEGGSPGYLFSWNKGLGNIQNPTNLAGGSYKVNIEDAFGCETAASIEIKEDKAPPTVRTQAAEILNCIVEEITLSAEGTSMGSEFAYQWTTLDGNIRSNATSLNPIINQAGTYQLQVSNNENGCVESANLTVQADVEKPDIQIQTPQTLNCKDDTQLLTGELLKYISNYVVQWSSTDGNFIGDTDLLATQIDAAGTYSLEIQNEDNGCITAISTTVTEDKEAPVVSMLDALPLTCERTVVSLQPTVEINTDNFEFAWSTTNGNFIENRNTLNPVVDQAGIYELFVRDMHNYCETTAYANVHLDTLKPTIDAGESFIFTCDLTSTQLAGSIPENGNFEYHWTTTDGNIIGGANLLSPLVNAAGNYAFLVKNLDNGCTATDQLFLEDDVNRPSIEINTPQKLTCELSTLELDASNSAQGNTFTYQWETENGQILNADNPLKPIIASGGIYTLIIQDASNDCEAQRSIEVGYDTIAPIAHIIAPEILSCQENEVRLDASNSDIGRNFSFNWTTNDGNITSKTDVVSPTVNKAGIYHLEIINLQNSCNTQASLSIKEEKPEDIEMHLEQPLCFGEKGKVDIGNIIGGVPPYTYSIDGGNFFYANPQFNQLNPGFYNMQVKDSNGCILENAIQIDAPVLLTADLGTEASLALGDSMQLEVQTNIPTNEIADIIWSPDTSLSCDDCLTPTVKPHRSNEYEVNIININGCQAQASLRLLVDQTPHIFVPNVFRPFNGKAGNDRITIFSKQGLIQNILSFEIYTRWGEAVFIKENFTPNDPNLGWDGRFKNKKMRPAVFVYRADVELLDGRKIQLKGDFALLE